MDMNTVVDVSVAHDVDDETQVSSLGDRNLSLMERIDDSSGGAVPRTTAFLLC